MRFFVYGTLTDAETADRILDSARFRGRATLSGLHRVDGAYPTLCPGSTVDGRILETPQVDQLDRYEGVEQGLYVRVTVPVENGETVETYVGDPTRLGVESCWPGEGSFQKRVREYVETHDVCVVR